MGASVKIESNKKSENKKRASFSIHLTADFYAPAYFVEDEDELQKILFEAARQSNSTPLKVAIHKFPVQGITGVILLAESHISLHTWPEYGYAAVDVFTCGKNAQPIKALEYLKNVFCPKKVKIRHVRRGTLL
ncbi:MAG: adenosylmethionine decarboxylase [Candidatus Omnitrophica bacterium]|nr:adenosylmethionine decarboxylase [Candidatus Omnitrophota bacterium]